MKTKVCCFFGHQTIPENLHLQQHLFAILEKLITEEHVDTFLFGSKSRFNELCLELVTVLKETYPHIRRVYVRAEFPFISTDYRKYLLEKYEDTYYPKNILHSGKAVYVERNCEMIDKSHFCIVYYDEKYTPKHRKSGTKTALDYAVKHKKTVLNIYPLIQ